MSGLSNAVQAIHGAGTCRGCDRRITLTAAGTVRRHGPRGKAACTGSRMPPKERRMRVPASALGGYETHPEYAPVHVETIDTRGLV